MSYEASVQEINLTKTQFSYLKSANESPIGRTVCYGKTMQILCDGGFVDHLGSGVIKITECGCKYLERKSNGN